MSKLVEAREITLGSVLLISIGVRVLGSWLGFVDEFAANEKFSGDCSRCPPSDMG